MDEIFRRRSVRTCLEKPVEPEKIETLLRAVWLGVHPLNERIDKIKAQFDLPRNLKPFAVIAVGYPQEKAGNHFVDRWKEERVHYERL